MKKKVLNVAMFSDSFYPTIGGRENVINNLMTNLAKNSNSFLVTIDINGKKDTNTYPYKIIKCKSTKILKDCYLAKINKEFKERVEEPFKQGKVDIIHVQTKFALAKYALQLAKKYNLPIITTCHTAYKSQYKNQLPLIWKFVFNHTIKTINKFDNVFTVSNTMANQLIEYGVKKPITVIKNGNDFISYQNNIDTSLLDNLNIPEEENVLLYCGRLTEAKNLTFLIESLSKVQSNYKMIFIGNGQDKYYKKLTKTYNIQDNCIFTGSIYNKSQLSAFYKRANLLVHASQAETFGLTIREASTFCTPSLVIDGIATSEDILDKVNGFISEAETDQFASKIDFALNNKEILEKAGKEANLTLFSSWENATEEHLKEYTKIIKNFK